MRRVLALIVIATTPALAPAAELRLLPADVPLSGPEATQQLLLVAEDGGRAVADLTGKAKFTSSDPAVATVDEAGVVRAVGDGEAVVTATHGGKSAMAKVRVRGAKEPPAWSFRNHVIPLLTKSGCNSGACHGALAGKGGMKLSLRGYDPEGDHFVLTRQALTRRVNRQEPEKSLMLLKATRTVKHGGGTRFDEYSPEYRIVRDWIAAGAPGPKPDDARLDRIEVFPRAAVLEPEDEMRVVVRAWYTDGRAADVTRWARFGSSEMLVATADETGLVKVAGHGEAAVTVGFGTRVATVPVTSPFPNEVPDAVFASAARHNFIDELVLKKLRSLNLPPSPLCSDNEFIRRAYLDTCGILPTPEEVRKFLEDKSPDKRARLIDALLERPEFVDYWAYKWSDVLLISTRNLPEPAMWAFYRWVRESVADNKPWDRFARELLTATGSTLRNGAGNYYVLHRDVADLTESTCVTFLGMSVTCARCHNHPLEKWTQDQYWGLANLFSRVEMKNGPGRGEVLIQPAASGDVLHPRRGVAMPPTPLEGEPLPEGKVRDRRAYFAEWLTSADNPYFARALVNRVWANFLGRGLVDPVDDLRETNPPSNAELFDALAADFVKNGHDVKRLIRLILNSATYQRSAVPLPENAADDRFHSHYLVKRLSAEVALDAYSQVTGVPTKFDKVYTGVEGGTAATGNYPVGTRALQLPDSRVASPFLDAFGRPDREQVCSCERENDSSVGQALHLNNGQTLNDKLRAGGGRIDAWLKENVGDAEAVQRVFLLALCREPTAEEMRRFTAILGEMGAGSRREALEDLFWAVLTSREFLFNR